MATAILNVKIEGLDKQLGEIQQLNGRIKELSDNQKQLNKDNLKGSKQYAENQAELKQLKERHRDLSREVNNTIKVNNNEIDTYKSLSASLSNNRAKYKDLAVQNKQNTKEGKELLKTIQQQDTKLKEVDATVGQHQRNVGNYSGALKKVATTLTGIYATVKGAKVIWNNVNKSIMSTQATGDKFTQMATGMKSAMQEFYRTLATGDWSGFITNMKEAYNAGVEYAKQLDLIYDLTNANSITTAKLRTEEAEQMNILRDRTRSLEEREEAMNKLLDIKQSIMLENKELAEIAYNNEIDNIKSRTKLEKEEVEFLIGNKKAQKDINEGIDLNNKLIKESTKLKNIGTATDPVYKKILNQNLYNESLKNLTKEQQENIKYALAWNKVVDNEGEKAEATRESLTQKAVALENVNTEYIRSQQEIIRYKAQLQAIIDKEKESSDSVKETTKALKDKNKWMELQNEKQKELDAKEAEAEQKRIERQSQKKEQDKIDLENATEYLDKIAEDDIAREEEKERLKKEAEKKAKEEQEKKIENELKLKQDANNALLNSTSQLFGQLGQKNKEFAIAKIATDTAQGIAGAVKAGQSVPFPGNIVAVITGITSVLAGIAQAKSVLSQGFATGGFTGNGSKYEPAGIVHKGEWVANSEMVRSNLPLFKQLDSMQNGFASGGFASPTMTTSSIATMSSDSIRDIVQQTVSGVASIPVVQDINGLNSAQKMNRRINQNGDL